MDEKTQIIELYKLYVEMADRISQRRSQTNQFYMTLLSGILVVLSLTFQKNGLATVSILQSYIVLASGILGIIVCFVWQINIRSYRQLNRQKFAVIQDMEKNLPYPVYTKEWELLGEGKESGKYLQLTRVEKWVPIILIIPYFCIFMVALIHLI